MKKNVGRTDGLIRIIMAVFIIYFIDNRSSSVQIIMAVVAATLIFTAFSGICMLYKAFGFNTKEKKDL